MEEFQASAYPEITQANAAAHLSCSLCRCKVNNSIELQEHLLSYHGWENLLNEQNQNHMQDGRAVGVVPHTANLNVPQPHHLHTANRGALDHTPRYDHIPSTGINMGHLPPPAMNTGYIPGTGYHSTLLNKAPNYFHAAGKNIHNMQGTNTISTDHLRTGSTLTVDPLRQVDKTANMLAGSALQGFDGHFPGINLNTNHIPATTTTATPAIPELPSSSSSNNAVNKPVNSTPEKKQIVTAPKIKPLPDMKTPEDIISEQLNIADIKFNSALAPNKCDRCREEFEDPKELRQHKRQCKTPYQCDVCKKQFNQVTWYKDHMLHNHTNYRPVKCDLCDERFCSRMRMINHRRLHRDKQCMCELCGKSYKDNKDLKQHMRTHSKGNAFRCDVCHRVFRKEGFLKMHLIKHAEKRPFQCEICNKVYKNDRYLNMHLVKHHGWILVKCEQCDEEFRNEQLLNEHFEKNHSGKVQLTKKQLLKCKLPDEKIQEYLPTPAPKEKKPAVERPTKEAPTSKCPVCELEFPNKKAMLFHLTEHPDPKSCECEVCFKVFKTYRSLRVHRLSHTGTKIFKCDQCDKSFEKMYMLNAHKLKFHADIEELRCEDCDKDFNSKYIWNRHMLKHLKRKQYTCEECNKVFQKKSSLKEHRMFFHSTGQVFTCEVCNEEFTEKIKYQSHRLTHVCDKLLQCMICGQHFFRKCSLDAHIATHNSEVYDAKEASWISFGTNQLGRVPDLKKEDGDDVEIKTEVDDPAYDEETQRAIEEARLAAFIDEGESVSETDDETDDTDEDEDEEFDDDGRNMLSSKEIHDESNNKVIAEDAAPDEDNDTSTEMNSEDKQQKEAAESVSDKVTDDKVVEMVVEENEDTINSNIEKQEEVANENTESHTKIDMVENVDDDDDDEVQNDDDIDSQNVDDNDAQNKKDDSKIESRIKTAESAEQSEAILEEAITIKEEVTTDEIESQMLEKSNEPGAENAEGKLDEVIADSIEKQLFGKDGEEMIENKNEENKSDETVKEVIEIEMKDEETPKPKEVRVNRRKGKKPKRIKRTKKKRRVTCRICNFSTCDRDELHDHIKDEHGGSLEDQTEDSKQEEQQPMPCEFCQSVFATKYELRAHKRKCPKYAKFNKRGPFKCEVCLKEFVQLTWYKDHMLHNHTNYRPEKCNQCGERFCSKLRLIHHKRRHKQYTIMCDQCGRAFKDNKTLKAHLITHLKSDKHLCTICGRTFAKEGFLKQHALKHLENRQNQCKDCDKVFKNYRYYLLHLEKTHNVMLLRCQEEKCGELFRTEEELNEHANKVHSGLYEPSEKQLRKQKLPEDRLALYLPASADSDDMAPSPEPPQPKPKPPPDPEAKARRRAKKKKEITKKTWPCETCKRVFNARYKMKKHMESCGKPGPYRCDICQKNFVQGTWYKDHMLHNHSNYRPVQCDICSERFCSRLRLIHHMRRHKEKTVMCDQCGRGFKDRKTLKAHLKTHTKGNNHFCNLCRRSFKKEGFLKQHMLKHAEVRPFQCDICQKVFKNQKYLNMHLAKSHYIEMVSCKAVECDELFLTEWEMNEHMQKIHSGSPTKKELRHQKLPDERLAMYLPVSMAEAAKTGQVQGQDGDPIRSSCALSGTENLQNREQQQQQQYADFNQASALQLQLNNGRADMQSYDNRQPMFPGQQQVDATHGFIRSQPDTATGEFDVISKAIISSMDSGPYGVDTTGYDKNKILPRQPEQPTNESCAVEARTTVVPVSSETGAFAMDLRSSANLLSTHTDSFARSVSCAKIASTEPLNKSTAIISTATTNAFDSTAAYTMNPGGLYRGDGRNMLAYPSAADSLLFNSTQAAAAAYNPLSPMANPYYMHHAMGSFPAVPAAQNTPAAAVVVSTDQPTSVATGLNRGVSMGVDVNAATSSTASYAVNQEALRTSYHPNLFAHCMPWNNQGFGMGSYMRGPPPAHGTMAAANKQEFDRSKQTQ